MEKNHLESLLRLNTAIANISDKNELNKVTINILENLIGIDGAEMIVFLNNKKNYMYYMNTESTESQLYPRSEHGSDNIFPVRNTPIEFLYKQKDMYEWSLKTIAKKFPSDIFIQRSIECGFKYSFNLKLRSGGKEIGLLLLYFKKKHTYGANKQSFYQGIAHQLAAAVQNILTKEELEDREMDRTLQLSINNALLNTNTKEDLCIALARLLNDHIPFDIMALRIWSGSGLLSYWYALEKSESGDFKSINEQVSNEASDELRILEENKNSLDKLPGIFTEDKFNKLCDQFPIYAYSQKAYTINSVLRLPFDLNMGKSAHIIFLSKNNDVYTIKHLSILEHCIAQISLAIDNLLAFKQLKQEKLYLEEEIKTEHNFEEIIGTSPALGEVLQKVSQVASAGSTVLIQGETGTGKELIARAIHKLSPQKDRTLLKVNCAALYPQLIESELFGHEKGSFTGATERRAGKFELANDGTIFLDEIGELSVELQAKILRVLQDKEIERIGGKNTIRISIRIIAATNRDLLKMISEGAFRSDLFYRLNVFPIHLPPLRKRKEDIPLIAGHFLKKFSKKMHKNIKAIAKESLDEMLNYNWPGNVRELEHVIEKAVILADEETLRVSIEKSSNYSIDAEVVNSHRFMTLKELEIQHILKVLKHCGGKIRGEDGAANILNIKPTTLESRMKRLGIRKAYVRSDE